jgi:hypothetical protein
MKIVRQPDYNKPRPASAAATLAAVTDDWTGWKDIADRVTGISTETVKNNLVILREEGAIDMRYGPKGRSEYRLPENARG